jgi:HD-GYP domain-containing protein (c-di-GMP phosphodiesterase class II)
VSENRREDPLICIEKLNQIGIALSAQKDIHHLVGTILTAAMDITGADGGTLYRVTEDAHLKFQVVCNRSMGITLTGEDAEAAFNAIPLYDEKGNPNTRTVAAYSVLHDCSVNLEDAYDAAEFDFSGTRQFDAAHDYRSRSFLTVPLKNHENDIIGALQLINAIDPDTRQVIPFSLETQRLVESISSQAAVALTNRRLIDDLTNLFEAFIRMIATAIDEKSPYTGRHCRRVPTLTMMLARAASRTQDGPLREFEMTEQDEYELHVAAMLHDCGKITTPVHVMDKATKLETIHDRIETVDTRFEVLKRDVEIKRLLDILEAERSGNQASVADIDAQAERELARLDRERETVRRCNIGGEYMQDSAQDEIRRIGARTWVNSAGEERPFLSENELENLLIRKGTLTTAEREVINRHIVSTIDMLEALPFPKHLRNVAEYAGGHHERMDGEGYPRGLKREQMSVQARVMGIADIFEALSSRDRPYKQIKRLSECMSIMSTMSRTGHIDPDLFEIFVRHKVYLEYAREHMNPEQIDAIDEEQLLAPIPETVSASRH